MAQFIVDIIAKMGYNLINKVKGIFLELVSMILDTNHH